MNKILLRLALFILSLVKQYPMGCFEDFGLCKAMSIIESLYGLEKRMNILDMDNLLTSIDSDWNIKKIFKPILETMHKEHKQIQDSNRYALILRELLYAYREDVLQEG
jgi:hypothetical protein